MTRAVRDHETEVKSYRYLRVAMVALLVFLGIAVLDQSLDQGGILSSISAYYYTSAQAVFVGVLVAVGVCMIAVQGTTDAEDILLNIGGMFALIVALVPTARDADTRSALEKCQSTEPVFTDQGTPVDCSRLEELEAATRLNIDNNVTALLWTGLVALAAAVVLHRLAEKKIEHFRWYISAAVGVYLFGVLFFLVKRELFVDLAHYFAAIGLFACIIAVAIVNALRRGKVDLSGGPLHRFIQVLGVLFRSGDRYAFVARAMLLAVVIGFVAAIWGPWSVTLFWLEAALIALFAALWITQTLERWDTVEDGATDQHPPSSRPEPVEDGATV